MHDDGLYQDFAEKPGEDLPPTFHAELRRIEAGRDVIVSSGDVSVTTYFGMTMLQPHRVDPRLFLSDALFQPPPMTAGEPPTDGFAEINPLGMSVLALLGPESSGRRTVALRQLADMVKDRGRIHELYPDWEQPDVSRIPCEPNTGYLLNLRGMREPLGERFHEQLAGYVMRARAQETVLVVIATERIWHGGLPSGRQGAAHILHVARPSALEIARRRIVADAERAERRMWLEDPSSSFHGLLKGDEAPVEGVRLAEVVLTAAGPRDPEARDRFLGWEHKLTEWFGSDDADAPERRALQIAASFLDGGPARTVLDAADALLADDALNWPTRPGGPLAGADDSERCAAADLDFRDGTISISRLRPGIEQALLQHVWRQRPQLVPVVARWLSAISRPKGVAQESLPLLARALTGVAASEGVDNILGLVQEWLSGSSRHAELAIDVLERLAVHPSMGPAVRRDLLSWAKAPTRPERQRAVVAVCRGELGTQYTNVAVTRLKHVIDKAGGGEVREEAVQALAALLGNAGLRLSVLGAIVLWAGATESQEAGGATFLDVLDVAARDSAVALARDLLTAEGDERVSARALLRTGWGAVWRQPDLRERAGDVLSAWCDAVEAEDGLPQEAVEEVVSVVFDAEADGLGDDLNKVIGGTSPFRTRMRTRFVDTVRESAMRRVAVRRTPED